jgi:hypothetical protein
MKSPSGHILKSNDVKLEGLFRLDVGQRIPNVASKANITSIPAQVRLVENHPEFAVVEVTCGCGAKTLIRCEYTDNQATEQRPEQKINGENEDAN